MAGADDDMPLSPFDPLLAEVARMRKSNLSAAIQDVDSIIDLLVATREQVAHDDDAHRIGMAMTTLQNPVKARLESITDDLKDVTKAQRSFGKALDRALPHRDLPMEADAMADQTDLINRAVAMHLLREGQFSVASTFLREEQEHRDQQHALCLANHNKAVVDEDGDDEMGGNDDEHDNKHDNKQDNRHVNKAGREERESLPSEDFHGRFSDMYDILAKLKERNLVPAIEWARANNPKLEAKGSNLEFELSKLQYVWLFKGSSVNGLPDDENNGQIGAYRYARQHFGRFQSRHMKEIQKLSCALVYASNLESSPYRQIFEIDSAFEDVSVSFTREFCSLLGLSAESPLYVAVTAGSIALPRLLKYTTYMKEKKTEWTTENELAFETPLPPSMIYHPIFVCPVSKEQTTEKNPPMMLPCGHVICKESLHNIAAKASKYKCPYCPTEGYLRDATEITL